MYCTRINIIMYCTRINKTNLRHTVLHTPVIQQTKLDSVIKKIRIHSTHDDITEWRIGPFISSAVSEIYRKEMQVEFNNLLTNVRELKDVMSKT